jgi:hypothetical protein
LFGLRCPNEESRATQQLFSGESVESSKIVFFPKTKENRFGFIFWKLKQNCFFSVCLEKRKKKNLLPHTRYVITLYVKIFSNFCFVCFCLRKNKLSNLYGRINWL